MKELNDRHVGMYKPLHTVINKRGRFNTKIRTSRLRRANDGLEFVLVWKDESGTGLDITITQKDIGELQLAKAAIFGFKT